MSNVITGTYVGNGSSQSLALGVQPALVVIHSTAGNGAGRALTIKAASMADDDAMACSTAATVLTSGGVTLTATGFDVGNKPVVNTNGQTYHYMAIVGVVTDTFSSSYAGNAASSDGAWQEINLGGEPELAMVFDMGAAPKFMMASKGGNSGSPSGPPFFRSSWLGNIGNSCMVLSANGFKVQNASADSWNVSGSTYLYFALFNVSTPNVESGRYTVVSTSPVPVATTTQPKAVWIIHDLAGGFKTDTMSGDDDGKLTSGYDYDTSGGVTITSTGFDVGTDFDQKVNRTTAWIAWH